MSEKRKDNKGRILKTGESQRKDGIYQYRYTDFRGKRQTVYASTLHVNVNIKMIKKWKIKMYICQELFLSLCFHKGPFLFQTV